MTTRARALLALLAAAMIGVAGCTDPNRDGEDDGDNLGPEEVAAQQLADALQTGDFSDGPFTDAEAAQQTFDEVTEALSGVNRQVEVNWVSSVYQEGEEHVADAAMRWSWDLPGDGEPWSYPISIALRSPDGEDWAVDFDRTMIGRELGEQGIFAVQRTEPERGDVLGAGEQVLVTLRPVYRIGIDKTFIDSDQWEADALALAEELELTDPQAYADRVLAYGPRAFVDAVVIPQDNPMGLDLAALRAIDGVHLVPDERFQGPTDTFARPILGRVGEATAEIIEDSDGEIVAGDVVGLSGLQSQYETQFAGVRGTVVLVTGADEASDGDEGADGEGTESDEEADGEGTESDESAGSSAGTEVYRTAPADGHDLITTLDLDVQLAAEQVLSDVEEASALVAIQPSTGDILAAASGPGSQGWSTATLGQYAPGSTFKMITTLALLRTGMDLEDSVECPATVVVDGRTFRNHPEYPDDAVGQITLGEAIAHSCNTAFIAEHERLEPADVASAARSLGLLDDTALGFPHFLGSVPQDVDGTSHAAALIGQGQILTSPLGMATVAASIGAGSTVPPTLITNLEDFTAGAEDEEGQDGRDEDAGSDDDGGGSEDAGTDPDDESDTDPDAGVPGDDAIDDPDAADESEATQVPLTNTEAAILRQAMRGAVTDGTAEVLADVPGERVVAKTGTAEHGTDGTTRAWLIAVQEDLAVAVFVEDGESGAATAGPIMAQFLTILGEE